MPNEIVISRKDRRKSFLWNLFLIILGFGSIYYSLRGDFSFDDVKGLIAGLLLVGVGVWKLEILFSRKPLLETSIDGVMLCTEDGRCYVPWSNIKEISAILPDAAPGGFLPPKYPHRWIKFEFFDPNEIYYDSDMHRLADGFGRNEYVLNLIKYLTISPFDFVQSLQERQVLALEGELAAKQSSGETKATDDRVSATGHNDS